MAKKVIEAKEEKQKKAYGKYVASMIVAVALGTGGYLYVKNPAMWQKLKNTLNFDKEDIYQEQINALSLQLEEAKLQLQSLNRQVSNPDYSKIYERIDNMEQINVNTIKSKANVETVLGLIGRMDNAEGRINDLAKVTDNNALTLMGAMLVKDAAERNNDFVYEAEVLSEIAKENYKIKNEVEVIEKIAKEGLPRIDKLQEIFELAYLKHFPKEAEAKYNEGNNWKDRVYSKLNKVVQIKKKNEDETESDAKVSDEDKAWEIVAGYIRQGNVIKALGIVKKPLNHKLAQDKNLQEFIKSAQNYEDFYQAISKISANTLAVMKVDFLRR